MGTARLLALGVCALTFLSSTVAVRNCNLADLFASDTLEILLTTALAEDNNPGRLNITVHRNHTVCLSVGELIEKVNSISLLIDYSCTGNSNCPGDGSSGRGTEQFDFGCDTNGQWIVGKFSDYQAAREENPSANFETPLRKYCDACFRQNTTNDSSQTYLPYDQVTHCVSKSMMLI